MSEIIPKETFDGSSEAIEATVSTIECDNVDDITNATNQNVTSTRSDRPKRRLSFAIDPSEENKKQDTPEALSSQQRGAGDLNLLSDPKQQSDSTSDSNASSVKTRRLNEKDFIREENESACWECEGGGELICCDTCVRAYHLLCLPQCYRPNEHSDASTNEWSCPVCSYFRVHDDLEKRRGVLLTLNHLFAVPSRDCDPRPRPKHFAIKHFSSTSDSSKEKKGRKPAATAKKSSTAEPPNDSVAAPVDASQRTEPTVGSRTRRAASAAANKKPRASAAVSATTINPYGGTAGRINVGPSFQAKLPLCFLEVQDFGRSYDHETNHRYSRAMADTRVVYSVTEWRRWAKRLRKGTPFDEPEQGEQEPAAKKAKLHQEMMNENNGIPAVPAVSKQRDVNAEPVPTENEKNLAEIEEKENEDVRVAKLLLDEIDALINEEDDEELQTESPPEDVEYFVDTEEKLNAFCRILSDRWSARCHWPYCDEYAYKILNYAKFNSKAALRAIDDPLFDFYGVCDPPLRPYFNKWRPKDKRSTFPSTPFPPPSHRSRLCRTR